MALSKGLMKAHDGHQRCLLLLRMQGALPSLQMAQTLRAPDIDARSRDGEAGLTWG